MLKLAKIKLSHIFKQFEQVNPEVAKTIKYVAMDTSGEVFGYKSKPYLDEEFVKDFEDEEGYISAQWMPEYLAGKGDDDFYIVIGEVMCPHYYDHKTAVIAVNKKRVKRVSLTKQQKLKKRQKLENKPKPLFETVISVKSSDTRRIEAIKQSLGVDKRKKHTNVWYATDANDKVLVEMSIRRENVLVMVY